MTGKTELLGFTDLMNTYKSHPVLLSSAIAAALATLALRRYFRGGVCHSKAILDGKTVLITGGYTGIGRATAHNLAARGACVIIACRDLIKAERAAEKIRKETGNQKVHVKQVDLASLDSVRKLSAHILETQTRLDILINNAGIMACPQWKSEDGYDMQFAVNHLSHFLLTNLLLELINKTGHGRIVNVSALAHIKGQIDLDDINLEKDYGPVKAYCQSKLANILFTRELHRRLQGTTTSTYSLHPGIVWSRLGRHVGLMNSRIIQLLLMPFFLVFAPLKTPEEGAQTTIFCAVTEGLEQHSGKYFSDCQLKDVAPQAKDDDMATALWDLSASMVKLN